MIISSMDDLLNLFFTLAADICRSVLVEENLPIRVGFRVRVNGGPP